MTPKFTLNGKLHVVNNPYNLGLAMLIFGVNKVGSTKQSPKFCASIGGYEKFGFSAGFLEYSSMKL